MSYQAKKRHGGDLDAFYREKEASLIGHMHCTTPSLRRSGEGTMMETGERSVISRGWRQAGTNRRGTDSWVGESTQHGSTVMDEYHYLNLKAVWSHCVQECAVTMCSPVNGASDRL